MRILIFNIVIADSEIFRRLRLTLSEGETHRLWQASRRAHGTRGHPDGRKSRPITSRGCFARTRPPLIATSHPALLQYTSFINTRRDALHNRFWGLTWYIYVCVGEYLKVFQRVYETCCWKVSVLIIQETGASCHTVHCFPNIALKCLCMHKSLVQLYWTFPQLQKPIAGHVVTPWGKLSQSLLILKF